MLTRRGNKPVTPAASHFSPPASTPATAHTATPHAAVAATTPHAASTPTPHAAPRRLPHAPAPAAYPMVSPYGPRPTVPSAPTAAAPTPPGLPALTPVPAEVGPAFDFDLPSGASTLERQAHQLKKGFAAILGITPSTTGKRDKALKTLKAWIRNPGAYKFPFEAVWKNICQMESSWNLTPTNWNMLWQTVIQQAVSIHPINAQKFANFGNRILQMQTRMGLPWKMVSEYISKVFLYVSAGQAQISDPHHDILTMLTWHSNASRTSHTASTSSTATSKSKGKKGKGSTRTKSSPFTEKAPCMHFSSVLKDDHCRRGPKCPFKHVCKDQGTNLIVTKMFARSGAITRRRACQADGRPRSRRYLPALKVPLASRRAAPPTSPESPEG